MKILGIDPALQTTGYGIIDTAGARPAHIVSGTLATRPDDPMEERLDSIYTQVSSVIERFKPDAAVLEKVFVHHGHTTTAFLLGQARGTIILACSHKGIPVAEYAATQVKKAVVGRGHATKQQVQRMVISFLSMKQVPRAYDVTDALALALTHTFHYRTGALAQVLDAHRR
ncbi:MAG: crossover junction endodeoxyribonuclease RuvC [Candidatus Omnitrophica bacterium]|nr:crossover junction endodeoxyribonuclease RuvC [Candidatus Omnitrophota bacterium]MDD5775481.1 crossover junction endodeoxyribonuclease RuvC [Candidatus Omnitrophota bacterium]HNQ51231.1 crossover junction endodeoxyribonuclease RuvC [Candidatus Omnitrophota bacterium]HQO38603.1 crossover junction endodeoxyribonuclease RuvC [Candidatus Omnitrophota bacterium]HQQ06744.1 crossover junction endodeoxyribonuclease RuvC [Candidatus Omnitrophota bacterium]